MSEWRGRVLRGLGHPLYVDDFGVGVWPWVARVREWMSRWLGVGQWFRDGKDNCWRCGGQPSDMDFMMRRVGPFRAECLDRAECDIEIKAYGGSDV